VNVAERLAAAEEVTPLIDPSLEASEDTIATAFAAKHGASLRFDHDQGMWFEWVGSHWRRDKLNRAFHWAREVARTIGKGKRALAKASAAAGVERFARAHPVHAAEASIWDRDAMLLGTPEGTVDLSTGVLRAAKPDDYITKLTSVGPVVGEPTLWLKFLREALRQDEEAIRFYQQWLGYCLTGQTTEHGLLFLYGPGGNGKSVAIDTQVAIQGDYAATSAMETFTASKGERHSTDLAMLQGARLVTANETEEGRSWNEARVKQLTGGDLITARFMRQDNFTFRPQFKLTIAGNHPPVLHNVDDAMRRRMNILPFVAKPKEPDPMLVTKLKEEHGRILAWMIEGCLDWQRSGLTRPPVVENATADYFDAQDMFGQWLQERCDLETTAFELPAKLYNDWSEFAKSNGEAPGTSKAFYANLPRRGFIKAKTGGLRIYRGLALRQRGATWDG
jgi:putative DNA primase/helicase